MPTETLYWEAMKAPHDLALKNLDKLVETCIQNNFLGPQNLVSAMRLAQLAQINYPQMAKLLNRPGFVKVIGPSSGWYWLRDFGTTYPRSFPNSFQIPKQVIITNDSTILNNREADKAIRSQIRPQDLLNPDQVIITINDSANQGEATYAAGLQMIQALFDSMIKLESQPERYAAAIYQMSKHLHDGTLKFIKE